MGVLIKVLSFSAEELKVLDPTNGVLLGRGIQRVMVHFRRRKLLQTHSSLLSRHIEAKASFSHS